MMNRFVNSRLVTLACVALTTATIARAQHSVRPAITISSPLDYQVIQRSSKSTGVVPLVLKTATPLEASDSFEYRIHLEPESLTPWQELNVESQAETHAAKLTLPAGGWYRLDVLLMRGQAAIASAVVDHVGVGELFVVAGQSNSANHGEERQRTQTERVVSFDGQRWRLANDPQPGASGDGGSFMPPLGDALAGKFDVPIGFIACGIGATSVREWLPQGIEFPHPPTIESRVRRLVNQPGEHNAWESDGQAFQMLIKRIQPLGPRGFRAVLWHQGESDANQSDASRTLPGHLYREYLSKIIIQSRREFGWEAPWFVALASYHVPGDEGSPEIRSAQASLGKDGIAIEGPDSDALKGDLRERNGQGVHFSGKGLREHASRWAEKISPWLERQLASIE